METIQQIATTAAKVVWGEGDTSQAHQEPISGVGGDVSKGEPYDAGNIGTLSLFTLLTSSDYNTQGISPSLCCMLQ